MKNILGNIKHEIEDIVVNNIHYNRIETINFETLDFQIKYYYRGNKSFVDKNDIKFEKLECIYKELKEEQEYNGLKKIFSSLIPFYGEDDGSVEYETANGEFYIEVFGDGEIYITGLDGKTNIASELEKRVILDLILEIKE